MSEQLVWAFALAVLAAEERSDPPVWAVETADVTARVTVRAGIIHVHAFVPHGANAAVILGALASMLVVGYQSADADETEVIGKAPRWAPRLTFGS